MGFLKEIYNFYLLLLDYYLFNKYKNYRICLDNYTSKHALIIGNGPSLSSVNFKSLNLSVFDIYVVNAFSRTELYLEIKPQNYCILDPLYFELQDERVINRKVDVLDTWNSIFTKTTWEMTIYVSINNFNKIELIKSSFPQNNLIKFVNLFPLRFKSSNKFYYYSKGLGFLGGNTVVQLALNISILKKNPKTFLIGIDHNWFENFKYDDTSDDIYLLNMHFYGESRIYYPSGEINNLYDLSGEFSSLHNSFEQFKELYLFSKFLKLDIFRSTKSFLHFIPFHKID
jgi:hypothetical protein